MRIRQPSDDDVDCAGQPEAHRTTVVVERVVGRRLQHDAPARRRERHERARGVREVAGAREAVEVHESIERARVPDVDVAVDRERRIGGDAEQGLLAAEFHVRNGADRDGCAARIDLHEAGPVREQHAAVGREAEVVRSQQTAADQGVDREAGGNVLGGGGGDQTEGGGGADKEGAQHAWTSRREARGAGGQMAGSEEV
jgi:hypothetical protein